jgi:hypothetical protein
MPADNSYININCFQLNFHIDRHIQDFSASSSIPTRSFQSTLKRLWSDIRASSAMKFHRMSLPSPTPHIDQCCKVSESFLFIIILITFQIFGTKKNLRAISLYLKEKKQIIAKYDVAVQLKSKTMLWQRLINYSLFVHTDTNLVIFSVFTIVVAYFCIHQTHDSRKSFFSSVFGPERSENIRHNKNRNYFQLCMLTTLKVFTKKL